MVFSGGAGRGGKPGHKKVENLSIKKWKTRHYLCGYLFTVGLMIYLDDSILVTDEKAAIYIMLKNLFVIQNIQKQKRLYKGINWLY